MNRLTLTPSFMLVALTFLLLLSQTCGATPYSPADTGLEETSLHRRSAGGSMPRPPYGTTILNSSQLPLILSRKTTETSDTHSIETIRNKLALYAFALDGKEFSVFDQIFDKDAIANYSAPLGLLNGLDNITSTLAASETIFSASQHLLGSQFVQIVDQHDAFSVSYYRSAQFGTGENANQAIYAFGQYQDTWFRSNPRTQEWRIIRRNLVYMTPFVGNLSAFGG